MVTVPLRTGAPPDGRGVASEGLGDQPEGRGVVTPVPGGAGWERKSRGAFFTPPQLCEHVVRWAVRDARDRVLEPSCGEAAFLLAASRRLRLLGDGHHRGELHGMELHEPSAAAASAALRRAGETPSVRVGDFLGVPATPTYDAVVGNPPYVRYQSFHGEARARARAAALRAGVSLTSLANSWAAFTVHASMFLRPGGRLGLVLPAELLSVNYAAPVRRYLLSRFGRVRLVLFTERVFPGVQEEVVLLLAEGTGPTDRFEVHQVRDLDELASGLVTDGPSGAPGGWRPDSGETTWMPALMSPPARDALRAVTEAGTFTPLSTWGRTTLGAVTGNNRWFALSRDRAYALGLPDDELVAISPPGSRHLRALTLTSRQWKDLTDSGSATLLFRPGAAPSAAARAYIAAGERAGVDDAYKCRVRRPWWRVPLQARPADLLLTYMNAHTPQLASNGAGVAHLNSVHGVALDPAHRTLGRDTLALAALNTVTMLGAETSGRAYGGGMLKLEPREAGRLLVPSPALVAGVRAALADRRRAVLRALSSGQIMQAAALVDEVLLAGGAGLRPEQAAAIAQAREAMWSRRIARGRRTGDPGDR